VRSTQPWVTDQKYLESPAGATELNFYLDSPHLSRKRYLSFVQMSRIITAPADYVERGPSPLFASS
jgi:hypothetical protein